MPVEALVRTTDRHARLRWLGVALFGVALLVLATHVGAVVTARAPLKLVLLSVFGLGVSLGTFGANDDTALHALAELARRGRVPARHQAEWDRERAARPARLLGLHASPRASLVLPVIASVAVAYAAIRGFQAWGLAGGTFAGWGLLS